MSPVAESRVAGLSVAELQAAHERIRPFILQTPVLESVWINEFLNARVLFKAETLQKTGSFKARGALNFISQLSPQERQNGVVAFSSGNHAQAVAWASQLLGMPAVIVMPKDAPRIKVEGTLQFGAEVVFYDRLRESREAIALQLAADRGAVLVPPFDHPWTMAGQGTVGLELLAQAEQLGATLDEVFIPCSGGGLTAGCASAIKALSPETAVLAVEPWGYDDTFKSCQSGQRQQISAGYPTLCDALALTTPGEQTFAINQALLDGVRVVDDATVKQAMSLVMQHLKLIVEPGGAVGLAALLSGPAEASGKTIGVVLSGGNVDPDLLLSILREVRLQPVPIL